MKRNITWGALSILILLAVLLTACGAAPGAEAEPDVTPDEPLTALESVAEDTPMPVPDETEADEPPPATEAAQSDEIASGEAAMPVEVDLREITPEPADGSGENIVMPAPGQPGPPANLVESVIVDLERRLGATRAEASIQLEDSELLNWPDAALGCPAEGMMYATVLTPGYQLLFSADGKEYTYHTDLGGYFVLCVNGKPAP